MHITEELSKELRRLVNICAREAETGPDTFREICRLTGVVRMYYDINFGSDIKYRDPRSEKLTVFGDDRDGKVFLYDSGEPSGLKLVYPYYYSGFEYVHSTIEFKEGITEPEIDKELYQFLADAVYTFVSRKNMRIMLDFMEVTDALTGIPNVFYIHRLYNRLAETTSPGDYALLRFNLKGFTYVNETAGSKAGDEAIIAYSRAALKLIGRDEALCRMGGDNFTALLHREHVDSYIEKLRAITISDLKFAPGRSFSFNLRAGISYYREGTDNSFSSRLSEASKACEIAKRLKKDILVYTSELESVVNLGRQIVAMFPSAVNNHEITPFFQAKVDMRTGLLVGFEALARWRQGDTYIHPDQFIPVLERENLIPKLDMAILTETCRCIGKWRESGLKPPRISVNFSKRNLYIPDIEKKILETVRGSGLGPEDIEIEITETMKESEYERLVEFVTNLKNEGFHIAVDDFGTGYSSLSLIHNIDVDVVKIDKSFVDKLPADRKARVLIESVVSIVDRLNFSTVAEGVETKEQGAALLAIGCHVAQGYYYSRPSDFETTTAVIKDPPFEPI